MNVIYASNDASAKYLGISILSLFDNNRDLSELSVYILAQIISTQNTEKLLVNLTQWRIENIENIFMDYYRAQNGQLLYND